MYVNKIPKFFVLLISTILFSCSNDNGDDRLSNCSLTGPEFSISDISGNWEASIAQYTDIISRNEKNIASDGGSVTLGIQSNGRFALQIQETGRELLVLNGEFTFCDNKFYAIFDDAPNETEEYIPELSDDTFRYYGPTDYDFNGDGTEERVFTSYTFIR